MTERLSVQIPIGWGTFRVRIKEVLLYIDFRKGATACSEDQEAVMAARSKSGLSR